MNERIQWIEHKGERILYIDASNLRDEALFMQLLLDKDWLAAQLLD